MAESRLGCGDLTKINLEDQLFRMAYQFYICGYKVIGLSLSSIKRIFIIRWMDMNLSSSPALMHRRKEIDRPALANYITHEQWCPRYTRLISRVWQGATPVLITQLYRMEKDHLYRFCWGGIRTPTTFVTALPSKGFYGSSNHMYLVVHHHICSFFWFLFVMEPTAALRSRYRWDIWKPLSILIRHIRLWLSHKFFSTMDLNSLEYTLEIIFHCKSVMRLERIYALLYAIQMRICTLWIMDLPPKNTV